jgi:hypothetical protein
VLELDVRHEIVIAVGALITVNWHQSRSKRFSSKAIRMNAARMAQKNGFTKKSFQISYAT